MRGKRQDFIKRWFTTLVVVMVAVLLGATLFGKQENLLDQGSHQIVFFEMEILRGNTSSNYSVILTNATLKNGKLKKEFPAANTGENQLKFSFLNNEMKLLKTTVINNPLRRVYEVAQSDHRTLKTEIVESDRACFSIRAQYNSEMKFLLVEAIDKNRAAHSLEKNEIGFMEIDLNLKKEAGYDAKTQGFDMVKVLDNGPANQKINIVVMGDGYQASELNKFMTDVNNFINGFFVQTPFDSTKSDFNVYAIKVISNVSGAAMDPNNLIDNYFGSTFWYAGMERLLVATDYCRIFQCLVNHLPQWDQPVILVNSSKYGGSGGWVATASTHQDSSEITNHEVGHSFGDLADEYWAGSQYAAEKANMTQDNNPSTIRWKDYLGLDGVGIYEYESPGEGWYRPHQTCKMRYLGFPFCLVCQAALTNEIQLRLSSPKIAINHSCINFGADRAGNSTGTQRILISNMGQGTLNWKISDYSGWLNYSPSSGTDAGTLDISVNATGLPAGTYYGTIYISDSNAPNSPQTVYVMLQVYDTGTTTIPFGNFSTPMDGSTVMSSIPVTGWVLDDLGVTGVKIYRDPVKGEGSGLIYIGDGIFVDGARPDVQEVYPGYPMNYRAGWGYMLLTNFFPDGGNGTFKLYSIATDIEGNQVLLGTRTIFCDNVKAVKPFGAIDTPAQGGTASGKNFINWGWVLTPQPDRIETDGSTIKVWVNGVYKGAPKYNIYRADIATLFPGYANSNGAAGYYNLDTTAYWNGVHTIQWTATDSSGHTDGIGSRYFTIQNTPEMDTNAARYQAVPGNNNRFQTLTPSEIEDLRDLPVAQQTPVKIRKGFSTHSEAQEVYHNEEGIIRIEIEELERVEIDFYEELTQNSQISAFMLSGNGFQSILPLPIGSTLDSSMSRFYWTPGPGFLGTYRLVFLKKYRNGDMNRENIHIKIVPKSGKKADKEVNEFPLR